MIIRSRVVVPIGSPPIENGAVAIVGDQIAAVGKYLEIAAANSGETIDLGEQALLPGLINAHCHLDYTCLRGKIPRSNSFTEWIAAINAEKAKLASADYLDSINEGFSEAKRFGTTTIANFTAFPELIAQIREPIRTWWFAEVIDVRDPEQATEIIADAVKQLRRTANWGLAPHAPFTASPNLYRLCEEIAEQENILLATHLAESRDEMSMFRDARGPLYEFLKGIGRDMSDCGSSTPVELLLNENVSSKRQNYLLVHLNELAKSDFDLLKGSRSSAVHCPRSHDYFGHSPFQFEKLKRTGVNICLGTDSLASNDNLSLFAEMRAFQNDFPNVPAAEVLHMVTANAARALNRDDSLGKIAPGFSADLIAIPCTKPASVFDEIIGFEDRVSWFMLAGKPQSA